jgi:hypothetical protein
MRDEQASAISRLVNDKSWQLFITPHLENRRETLIRDIKSKKELRDENVGRLLELDDFTAWVSQQEENYKEQEK